VERAGKNMKRKITVFALCALLFTLCGSVDAQQAAKLQRIGIVSELRGSSPNMDAFEQGLRERGYVEGKNISIERRYTMGDAERLPTLTAELVRLKVDVILAPGTPAALAAKNATRTIPIVFASVSDAVGSGLVESLARPAGNVTGLTQISPDLAGKRLEILKETVSRLSRVAVLLERNVGPSALSLSEIQTAARGFGIQLQTLEVADASAFDNAFQTMTKDRAGAVIAISTVMFLNESKRIANLAKKHRLPAIYTVKEYVDAGGLMSYGVSLPDLFRRAATYVDKILRGAKPADLPVEQPMKFELVINLKAAKQIGLTIPPNVLARADKVIR
jgi:putative tryptophan/tyrosine transport system substrate-binding protein